MADRDMIIYNLAWPCDWPCDQKAAVKLTGFSFCLEHGERIGEHLRAGLLAQTASDLALAKFARDDILKNQAGGA